MNNWRSVSCISSQILWWWCAENISKAKHVVEVVSLIQAVEGKIDTRCTRGTWALQSNKE